MLALEPCLSSRPSPGTDEASILASRAPSGDVSAEIVYVFRGGPSGLIQSLFQPLVPQCSGCPPRRSAPYAPAALSALRPSFRTACRPYINIPFMEIVQLRAYRLLVASDRARGLLGPSCSHGALLHRACGVVRRLTTAAGTGFEPQRRRRFLYLTCSIREHGMRLRNMRLLPSIVSGSVTNMSASKPLKLRSRLREFGSNLSDRQSDGILTDRSICLPLSAPFIPRLCATVAAYYAAFAVTGH